jgi:hypothetical protein
MQVRDEQEQQDNQDNQSEYLKFVGVLVFFLAVIFCLALLIPPLFSNTIPAALGLDRNASNDPGASPAKNNFSEDAQSDREPVESEPQPQLGPESLTVHTVQEGETLAQIAAAYNVTLEALAAANNIINPQQVAAGSVLVIPQPQ